MVGKPGKLKLLIIFTVFRPIYEPRSSYKITLNPAPEECAVGRGCNRPMDSVLKRHVIKPRRGNYKQIGCKSRKFAGDQTVAHLCVDTRQSARNVIRAGACGPDKKPIWRETFHPRSFMLLSQYECDFVWSKAGRFKTQPFNSDECDENTKKKKYSKKNPRHKAYWLHTIMQI